MLSGVGDLTMPHTQDLQVELVLIHLWPIMFPEQNEDLDGVKARFLRQQQIVTELERVDSSERSSWLGR